jgi:hypothetical protein
MGLGFAVFAAAMIGWFIQAGRQAADKAAHTAHSDTEHH